TRAVVSFYPFPVVSKLQSNGLSTPMLGLLSTWVQIMVVLTSLCPNNSCRVKSFADAVHSSGSSDKWFLSCAFRNRRPDPLLRSAKSIGLINVGFIVDKSPRPTR